MKAIPLADAGRLERSRRTTRLVRTALALVLAGLLAGSLAASLHAQAPSLKFLPRGSTGIVALDVSASISSDTYQRIGETLRELGRTNGRYGLVVFSDVAYQALPPGTPSAALTAYARYFTAPPTSNGFLPQFPVNPWTNSFSGGTRISAGLALALKLIRTEGISHPAVVLVSDLDDDPGDLVQLAGVALAYREANIPVRVVALNAAPDNQTLFARLLARTATVQQARLPGQAAPLTGSPLPVWLVTLTVLAALALAGHELWTARLTWGRA